jgi:hypothetical protein
MPFRHGRSSRSLAASGSQAFSADARLIDAAAQKEFDSRH